MYKKHPGAPVLAPVDAVPDPFTQCGCHPDVVSRLWNGIGSALPQDCRALVYHNPSLVHVKSGVILGIGLGTWYGLRLPGDLAIGAARAGAKTCAKFSTGTDMDIRRVLGDDWVFGEWLSEEPNWCQLAYEAFNG
jgi:hypothetical protein